MICIGDVTGVTESWITTEFRPNRQFWIIAVPTPDGGSIAPAAWRYSPRSVLIAQQRGLSSQEKTARTKPSDRLDPLRSSLETDRRRSFFAALGLCTRHKKVPPLHPASTCLQDHPRPGPVRVS